MGLLRSRLCIITVKWNESYATARDLCVMFIVVFLLIGINMSLLKLSLTHSNCKYKQQRALKKWPPRFARVHQKNCSVHSPTFDLRRPRAYRTLVQTDEEICPV